MCTFLWISLGSCKTHILEFSNGERPDNIHERNNSAADLKYGPYLRTFYFYCNATKSSIYYIHINRVHVSV